MMITMTFLLLLIFIACGFVLFLIYWKDMQYWMIGYIKWLFVSKSRKIEEGKLIHIMLMFVDHFEPGTQGVDKNKSDYRFNEWYTRYPLLAKKHKDSSGRHPQHTFFFPPHYHSLEYMTKLSEICFDGYGEIEFHLHHQDDNSDSLRAKINDTIDLYAKSGALITAESNPKKTYGFIHGNWALDNSRKDGKFCGVNNELQILEETGCYADFTMPSPDETQTNHINSIFYAKDNPKKPKSYSTGIDVAVGIEPSGDLMLVQGPLFINWKSFPKKIFPSIEASEVAKECPPTKERIDSWIKCGIHVKGRTEWIFIKLHTHGAIDRHHDTLLGKPRDDMYSYLETKYNDGKKYKLHYTSAREAYNIIKAAEKGMTGDPDEYRDLIIPKYANQVIKTNSYYNLVFWTDDSFQIRVERTDSLNYFEFKDKTIKRIDADLFKIDFKQDLNECYSILKLEGKGKGEAQLVTSNKINSIKNALIVENSKVDDRHLTKLKFEFIDKELDIEIMWGI
jgi:hypothetical protein